MYCYDCNVKSLSNLNLWNCTLFSYLLSGIAVYMLERSPKVGSVRSPWAVKKWLKGRSNETTDGRLRLEADVLRQLNHPNIIGFRAFAKGADGKPCLAMEALDMSLGIYRIN